MNHLKVIKMRYVFVIPICIHKRQGEKVKKITTKNTNKI